MRTTILRRSVAAAAAATIAGVGLVGLSSGAQAESGELIYSCSVSIYSGVKLKAVVETDLPSTVQAGSTVIPKLRATVVVSPSATKQASVLETLRALTVATVEGAATFSSSVNGAAQGGSTLPIAPTTLPATGSLTIVAEGSGAAFTPTTAGVHTVAAGAFTGTLTLKKADGSAPAFGSPAALSCTPDAGQDLTIDTVAVTAVPAVARAASKTTVTAKATGAKVSSTVRVTSKKKAASGKVTIKLMKGSKTVRVITKSLGKKGAAKVTFNVTKKGLYKVVATYKGSKTVKASTGSRSVRVR